MKNQSIHVAHGVLPNLYWILENITTGLFAEPLSANCLEKYLFIKVSFLDF